jgi:hypothetical protein
MITLATAAYAQFNEVNADRLTSITTSSIARFAANQVGVWLPLRCVDGQSLAG